MGKEIFVLDELGYFLVQDYIKEGDEYPKYYTETPLPTDEKGSQLPFYKPKWNGEKWVEGLTDEEIKNIQKVDIPKSKEEILLDRVKALEQSNAELMNLIMMQGVAPK